MCKLRSLTLEESNFLNCSDYCGTEDEECIGSDIRGATCPDVGCSGSGSPTCTESCRLDYSSCNGNATETYFKLELQTAYDAWETNWAIQKDDGPVWELDESYRNHDPNIREVRCMENGGCYNFELSDVGGDGLYGSVSSEDSGNILIVADGEYYGRKIPDFGSLAVFNFGTCERNEANSSFRNQNLAFTQFPSMNPSSTPSVQPTRIPTTHPSCIPTFSSAVPTSAPSVLPSLRPSEQPSLVPSKEPSLIPTKLPSEVPSFSPSFLPTDTPSLVPSQLPTSYPSVLPSSHPTCHPSSYPSDLPSPSPSDLPTSSPSEIPSLSPTGLSSNKPSYLPTLKASEIPSYLPTLKPSEIPSILPTHIPSVEPTRLPTLIPSIIPTQVPSLAPTVQPSVSPTASTIPTLAPTMCPAAKLQYPVIEKDQVTLTRRGAYCRRYKGLGIFASPGECAIAARNSNECRGYEIDFRTIDNWCTCCDEYVTENCVEEQTFFGVSDSYNVYQYSNPPTQPMCCD